MPLWKLLAPVAVLAACTPTQYRNTAHPAYGEAEYKADLAKCRQQNATVETTQGYDTQTRVIVDQAKAADCMKAQGWQSASP